MVPWGDTGVPGVAAAGQKDPGAPTPVAMVTRCHGNPARPRNAVPTATPVPPHVPPLAPALPLCVR